MSDARRYCTMQSVAGPTTSNMQMQRVPCRTWTHGSAVASVCVYGRVGNSQRLACETSSNAEYRNGGHINGEMRARDTGQWRIVE